MTPVYKLLIFLKRRPDLTLAEFRRYYEEVHTRLCEKYASGASRYVRRYLQPVADPVAGTANDMDFDVITEIWFEDRRIFDAVLAAAALGQMPAEVLADEERLFDRSKSRFASVIECDSDLAAVKTKHNTSPGRD